jgi:hypothetical protein
MLSSRSNAFEEAHLRQQVRGKDNKRARAQIDAVLAYREG